MRIGALDYDLPAELVAQHPLDRRDRSRLMVIDGTTGALEHRTFADLPAMLSPRSVLVLNDSRVFPARLTGTRRTGGRAEVLLVRRLSAPGATERWLAMVSASGRIRPGLALRCATMHVEVGERRDGPLFEVTVAAPGSRVMRQVREHGAVPLPPYIRRPPTAEDRHRYQTVYARRTGSVAAPTAGLHFTRALISELAERGHEIVCITLHVGPGTFQPIRSERIEDHGMSEEWVEVDDRAVRALRRARESGRTVVAVGTTVVRALEGVFAMRGRIAPYDGPVDLFIAPGHRFEVVDELITNLHLPRSTLLALVMALAGTERIRAAYAEAVRLRYRFYSYGDAMLVRGGTPRSVRSPGG
jgi:S-adenosylmethionine:tRNA ribosyltransferase-isomerase